ncbi:MAG: division/cell wall cluster transcriptional repressor MraZ [Candidatus Polarisedimenticolaceae bacterium]|nr:division/cell wall cluster transcriptional repressor MraZ [Candidatus Polarisedimenticolaceae bacterium]
MFRGVSTLNLDGKGRLAIPTKYRDELKTSCASTLVVTAGVDRCILIYPEPAWNTVERDLDGLSSQNPNVRKLQRLMTGYASDVVMDGQGRILLPPALRKHVNLEKAVALVGQGKKFELWSESAWNAQWLDDAEQIELSDPVFENLSF